MGGWREGVGGGRKGENGWTERMRQQMEYGGQKNLEIITIIGTRIDMVGKNY